MKSAGQSHFVSRSFTIETGCKFSVQKYGKIVGQVNTQTSEIGLNCWNLIISS